MPACPNCAADVREGKIYCGGCGASITGNLASAGSSKLEFDHQFLNSMLAIFVNKPGELHLQLSDSGYLQLQQGDLQVNIDPLCISQNLKISLRKGKQGPYTLQLNQLELGTQGLSLSLNLLT